MAEVNAMDEAWMHEPMVLLQTMVLPKRPTLDELTFADGIDDNVSPEDVYPTIDAVKELIGTKFNTAARLIDSHREIKRLIRAKLVYDKDKREMVPVAWKLDTQQRAAAIAHFLFTDAVDTPPCRQCEHHRSLGPMEQCVAGGRGVVDGACFNCYYSGSGGRCSIRTGAVPP
ncbi:hypothetical protein GE09DRAFT_735370 [Coniochaeta sp. 2T2.1]|nr:hypothetical protein GE09DRAFT_735370 [Coniochaeta sp. 2T2.1]